MATCVCSGALVKCMFGTFPTPLQTLPLHRTFIQGRPAATIFDHKPFVNIAPFGICNSPANPAVVAARLVGAVAPCAPIVPAPWIPGSPTVLLGDVPVLSQASKAFCVWAGMISVAMPGQWSVTAP